MYKIYGDIMDFIHWLDKTRPTAHQRSELYSGPIFFYKKNLFIKYLKLINIYHATNTLFITKQKMEFKDKFEQFKNIILNNKKFALFWHINPDWDAIWSILWLWKLLENLWKQVGYFTPNPVNKIFNFLEINKIKNEFNFKNYDYLIFCDFSSYQRIPNFIEKNKNYFDESNLIIFDHHQSTSESVKHAKLIIKDPESESCCQFLREFIYNNFNEQIDSQIATNLLTWHITDTWNFMYWENYKRVFKNALQMINYGANRNLIIQNIFYNKELGEILILKEMLNRLKKNNKIVYSWFDDNDLQNFDIAEESAKSFLWILQRTKWFDLYILFHIKKSNTTKIHFRSNTIDVAKIAEHFEWWWHKSAAWALYNSTNIEEIIKKITDLI